MREGEIQRNSRVGGKTEVPSNGRMARRCGLDAIDFRASKGKRACECRQCRRTGIPLTQRCVAAVVAHGWPWYVNNGVNRENYRLPRASGASPTSPKQRSFGWRDNPSPSRPFPSSPFLFDIHLRPLRDEPPAPTADAQCA